MKQGGSNANGDDESNDAPNHPSNKDMGSRAIPFGKQVYIEKTDFKEEAAEDFWRLKPGGSSAIAAIRRPDGSFATSPSTRSSGFQVVFRAGFRTHKK